MTAIWKRSARFFIWMIIVVMTVSALGINVGAEETDPIYTANVKLLAEKYSALSDVKNQNIVSETGRLANVYVEVYEQKLNKITEDKMYESSTKDLINLYYTQGVAANQIAWIYFTYAPQFEGEARAAIDRVHNGVHTATQEIDGLQDEIAYAANAEALAERLYLSYDNNGMCARLYVEIYRQKLFALLQETDSEAIKEIVMGENGAIVAMTKCTDVASSTQYEEIYLAAKHDVTVRRLKETAIEEIKSLYALVYPEGDVTSDERVLNAIAHIESPEVELHTEMNAMLKSAAESFVGSFEREEAYGLAYLQAMSKATEDEVTRADDAGEIADLSLCFVDFTLKLARADAKDSVTAGITAREYATDERMVALLNGYTCDGGVIDTCSDMAAIEFELFRATLRADLYGQYVDKAGVIMAYVGEHTLLQETYEAYDYADNNISLVDRDVENAEELCRSEYDRTAEIMDGLVAKAEVIAFETKHAEILQKENQDLTENDKEAVLEAIRDMSELSAEAKQLCSDKRTPDALAEKYKEIVEQDIRAILGSNTSIRKDHLYAVLEDLDDLQASGDAGKLATLVADANELTARALLIDKVLDRYEEIVAEEAYGQYSKEDRDALEKIARETTEAIRGGSDSADEAILSLDRAEACAKVVSYAEKYSDSDAEMKAKLDAIVDQACAMIDKESDSSLFDEIVSGAVLDVEKCVEIRAVEDKMEKACKLVNDLEMLTEEQKKTYEQQIRESLSKKVNALENAKDLATLNALLEDYDRVLTEIVDKAVKEDEEVRTEAKTQATELLEEIFSDFKESIANLTYLSEEKRTEFEREAGSPILYATTAIEQAKNHSAMSDAITNLKEDLQEILEKASEAERSAEESEKKQQNASVREKAAELIDKINGGVYHSEEEKAALKQQIEDEIVRFAEGMSAAQTKDEMMAVVQESGDALTAVEVAFDAQELGLACTEMKGKIEEEHTKLEEMIDGFRFLDEDRKMSLKTLGKQTADERIATLENERFKTVQEVYGIGENAVRDLQSQQNAAQEAENDACVETLSPFMVGFAVAFGVEAVLLLALWLIYRKKNVMSCFVPVVGLALMPSSLAWTLTALLAVADVALAVLIGYMIVKLVKLYRAQPILFPDDEDEEYGEIAEEDEELPHENTPIPTTATVPESKKMGLKARISRLHLPAPLQRQRLKPKPQLIYLMPPTLPQLLKSVSVSEANRLISDKDAFHCEETNIVNSEIYTGRRRGAINIDTISNHFSEGELVSLNTLKEKNLINKNVGHIKILGRGRIDKPLTVVAQNFSASAIKMIVLTGGSAVLAEGALRHRK